MKGLIVRLILSFVALAGLCGCDREYEGDLWFAGDSICHGWNVKSCFPDWRTHNYGVNGARIDRIEELAGRFAGESVVVVIGTNYLMWIEDRDRYADRYAKALQGLAARRIYLISILPRNPNDVHPQPYDEDIRDINSRIRSRVEAMEEVVYVNAYPAFEKEGGINAVYTKDGLHLNAAGYQLLSFLLSQYLLRDTSAEPQQ